MRRPAPSQVGQHNAEIYGELLGMNADELGGLSQAMRIGVDLESTRTSPMFNPSELSGSMYLAQHEP